MRGKDFAVLVIVVRKWRPPQTRAFWTSATRSSRFSYVRGAPAPAAVLDITGLTRFVPK
jgi:hypothetical protein